MTIPAEGGNLLRYEAVRLFTGRAAAVLPGFTLDVDNASAVASICRRLDGIPLAIELAAVRLRSLSPGQILARLDSRFPLLSGGGPADQPHHRTLDAALDWSYSLLSGVEQGMWRQISVFAGSFDLDAAEAVCANDAITATQVADLVDGLVAKSILFRATGAGPARYRLLDTIDRSCPRRNGETGVTIGRALHREPATAHAAGAGRGGTGRPWAVQRTDRGHAGDLGPDRGDPRGAHHGQARRQHQGADSSLGSRKSVATSGVPRMPADSLAAILGSRHTPVRRGPRGPRVKEICG